MSINQTPPRAHLKLDNPRSVAIYDTYEDAQQAIDYLADHKFAVQKLMIVGTDLKSIERVTGALTWGKVLMSGALSGVMWGMMLSVLLWIFLPGRSLVAVVGYGLVAGIFYGMLAQAVQYGFMRGRRDFASQTTVIATHYEILGEAEVFQEARRLLGESTAVERPVAGNTGILQAVPPKSRAATFAAPVASSTPNQTDEILRSALASSEGPGPAYTPAAVPAPVAPADAPGFAPAGPSPIVWRTQEAGSGPVSDDTDPGGSATRRAH